MNKKFISAILAGAMAVSTLGISVFAADGVTPNKQEDAAYGTKAQSYKVNAGVEVPEMKVTIPAVVNAVINPYGVSIKINDETVGDAGIISPVYTITNNTENLGIKVTATASATSDTVKILDTKAAGWTDNGKNTATGNQPEAYAEVFASVDPDTAVDTVGTGKEVIFKNSADKDYTETPVVLMVLTQSTTDDTVSEAKNVGYFQIHGSVSNLDNANKEIKWSKEKISYVLVLDITPAKATDASLGAPTA